MKTRSTTFYRCLFSSLFVLTTLLISASGVSAQALSSGANEFSGTSIGIDAMGENACFECACDCETGGASQEHVFNGACLGAGTSSLIPDIGIDYDTFVHSSCRVGNNTNGRWTGCRTVISADDDCAQ